MRYKVSELRKSPEDWHRIMAVGKLSGDGRFVEIDHGKSAPAENGRQSVAGPGKDVYRPIVAQARAAWPLWAKAVRLLRGKADRGVGDTLERLFKCLGIAWGVGWLGQIIGHTCKCKTRRDRMNLFYPYKGALKRG